MAEKIAQSVMTVLLLLGAAVQFNDPDPVVWIAVYTLAALLCLLVALGRPLAPVMLALAALASCWSAWLASGVLGQQPLFDEEGREMMGLAIIALWQGGSGLLILKRQKATEANR